MADDENKALFDENDSESITPDDTINSDDDENCGFHMHILLIATIVAVTVFS
jgi:hypothetical protein